MGGGFYSHDAYDDRVKTRAATHTPVFAYTAAINAGTTARAVHPSLDPKIVAGAGSPYAGKVMRESRDSADHPESLAIYIPFDVTGSMGKIPGILQAKLSGLMKLLVEKGYVAHPQILFGAVGDATAGDTAPLQVGQFESDITMEDHLTNIFIEHGGGGGMQESYELAMYFAARHTSIDCFEKRGVKGYFFTIGDEGYYPTIRASQVQSLIGDKLGQDVSTAEIVRELQQKYHVYHIIAEQGSYPHDKRIEGAWRDLLGQHVIRMENSDEIAEIIASTIGLNEGATDIDGAMDNLKDVGVSASDSVREALVPLAATAAMAKAGVVSGLPTVADAGGITRL